MKRNCSVFAVFCLLALVVTPLLAQEMPVPKMSGKQAAMATLMMEPTMKAMFEKPRPGFLVPGLLMNPMFKNDFKAELGLSDEQVAKITASFMQAAQKQGMALQKLELDKRITEENFETFALNDEETAQLEAAMSGIFNAMDEAGFAHLSDEQKARMGEMSFVMFGGIDTPFFDLSETTQLDLSDAQKKDLHALYEEGRETRNAFYSELKNTMGKAFKTGKMDAKEDMKNIKDIMEAYALKLKTRVAEILTEEQLKKGREMMTTKMPKFLAKFGGASPLSQWVPGIDSWKPGDPVPEKAKKADDGKRKFPGQE